MCFVLFYIFCLICIQIVSSQIVQQSKYWEEKDNVISNTSSTYKNTTDWGYRMSYYGSGAKIEYFDIRPACCQSTVKYFDGKTNFDTAFAKNTIHRFNYGCHWLSL